jgi:hypothetical protein
MTNLEINHLAITWAQDHFPMPTAESDDIGLELYLRDRCIQGSGYFAKLPTGVNLSFSRVKRKTPNIYSQYFLNGAQLENLQNIAPNFRVLATSGGYRYTNEYQYCTVLRDQVDPAVVERARELLAEFNIKVP